jgi:hypothetical protein
MALSARYSNVFGFNSITDSSHCAPASFRNRVGGVVHFRGLMKAHAAPELTISPGAGKRRPNQDLFHSVDSSYVSNGIVTS